MEMQLKFIFRDVRKSESKTINTIRMSQMFFVLDKVGGENCVIGKNKLLNR